MNCVSLRFVSASVLALSLTAACNPRGETSASASEGSSTGDATDGATATSAPTTSVGGTSSSSSEGTSSTTANPTTGVTTESPCQDTPMQPINSECTDASGCGCDTGKCFVVPALGGFCGECLSDADCSPGGCSVPNPIAGVGATCNMGGPGEGCESDAVCVDPANAICGTLLSVPGIITVSTCGQCKVNADCTDPALPNCTPTYDVLNFKGKLDCIADGALENNSGCSLEDDGGMAAGNKACKSGFCGEASVMGLLKLGICGECLSDADCGMGKMCVDPAVDLNAGTLIGAVCM